MSKTQKNKKNEVCAHTDSLAKYREILFEDFLQTLSGMFEILIRMHC